MLKQTRLLILPAFVIQAAAALAAEEDRLRALERNTEVFAGVLEEALGLNQGSGLFGMGVGGVEATYLLGQGVVFEIRSPLANRRNRLGVASLNSAMRSLADARNPFESAQRPSPDSSDEQAAAADAETAESFYREMMERIAGIDYSLVVNSALQQASESIRSLRSLGDADAAAVGSMQNELDGWREQLQLHLQQLAQLQQRIEVPDADTIEEQTAAARGALREQLNELLAQIEPLREQAVARAEELKLRAERAEAEYAQRWQRDLDEFETNLYAALCDYGATLRELPTQEHISVVLQGLGAEAEGDTSRRDKLHILTKSDVLACQRGDLDAAALRQRSRQYSF